MPVLLTPPYLQFFDEDGVPLDGGKVYTYTATGTFTIGKAAYTTEEGNVEHSNPIILDAAGRPPGGSIWISGTYDFKVTDSLDNLIETTLNVTAFTALPPEGDSYFQSFSGDGIQTAFTTSEDLGTDEKAIYIWIDSGAMDDVGYQIQNPSAYTINGTALTFSVAPAAGTGNIYVSAPSLLLGAASSAAAAAEAAAAEAAESEAGAAAANTSLKYTFDNSTTMADPGTGEVRLNNASLALVTEIAISSLTANDGNPNVLDFILTWDDSTNTPKGTIMIRKAGVPAPYAVYFMTEGVTDHTTWVTIPVQYVSSSGSLTNGNTLYFGFSRSGNAGAGGDVYSNASSSTNGQGVQFADSTCKLIKKSTLTGIIKQTAGVESVAVGADVLALVGPSLWPVGSVYYNKTVATNPATLFGFGTWVALADVFIVARGSTYTSTGGSATATLGAGNLPAHTHNLASNAGTGVAVSDIGTGAAVSGGELSSPGNNTKATLVTTSTGSSTPFSILPPYQAVYAWERTA